MQYKPDINEGNINAFDNLMQRNILYKYDSDQVVSSDSGDIDAKKYVENTFSNKGQ
jgi:hypothetical protein